MSCKSTLRLRVLVAGPQRHSSFSDVFCRSVSNKCFSLSFVFCRLPKQALFSNRCVVTLTIRSDFDQHQMIGFSILNLLYQTERVHSTGPFFVRTKHCKRGAIWCKAFHNIFVLGTFLFFARVPKCAKKLSNSELRRMRPLDRKTHTSLQQSCWTRNRTLVSSGSRWHPSTNTS